MANWDKIQERGKVDDRRGRPGGLVLSGAGGLALVAIVLIYGLTTGTDVSQVLDGTTSSAGAADTGQYAGNDTYETYVAAVTGSLNSFWSAQFTASGLTYQEPTTVLFRQSTESACGGASSAAGPHYCLADQTIYLDETFFEELTSRFGARGGDVAEAYVLAHEAGHHVQNQLGLTSQVSSNEDSIALELQADCFAGAWAKSVENQGVISREEVEQAIDAAAAVGDDRIQETTGGRVNPETWTHGSSAQRKGWFLVGFTTGDPSQCNTRKAGSGP